MDGKPLKLLIIEDDEAMARALRVLLQNRAGWDVCWTSNLDEAREALPDGFDAVLLDLKLPGEDGEDILEEIRDRCSDCRIVVVTGLPKDSPRMARVEAKHPDAILHKPYDIVGLMTALKGENPFLEK